MRPVNLIPGDQRRTRGIGRGPSGTGIAVYGVLGVLAVVVVGVVALVLTNNRINDRKSSVASLEQETASAKAAADTLRPYGDFAQMQRARVETVNSLVGSAYNWERTLRQLSRTIPSDTWLTSLQATVDPNVKIEATGGGGGGSSDLRAKAQHPAVQLEGCTYSHTAVARMMTRMKNIDDVTEVVLGGSERPDGKPDQGSSSDSSSSGGGGGGGGGDCRTKYNITKFDILIVLGNAELTTPVPPTTTDATATEVARGAVTTAAAANSASTGAGQ